MPSFEGGIPQPRGSKREGRFHCRLLLFGIVLLAVHTRITTALPLTTASSAEISRFFRTNTVNLLFCMSDSGIYRLSWTDGNEGIVRSVVANPDAKLPSISADGQWVTYATGAPSEYGSHISTVWLQQLPDGTPVRVADTAYVPRFLHDSDAPSIVYATCSRNTAAAGVYTWQGCGKMVEAVYEYGTVRKKVLYSEGSFLGGLSYDRRYFAHAEAKQHAFLYDRNDSSLLFLHCLDGTVPQVCNSSISSSRFFPDAVLYFDFGTVAGPTVLGGKWQPHTRLFISRSDGHIHRLFCCPGKGADTSIATVEWNYPEWSTHPYFAVATLFIQRRFPHDGDMWMHRGRNERVYAINLKDSSYLELARSLETGPDHDVSMRWPVLHVGSSTVNENSSWLSEPLYRNGSACDVDTVSTDSPGDGNENSSGNGRCGTGVSLAFLPVVVARFFRWKGKTL